MRRLVNRGACQPARSGYDLSMSDDVRDPEEGSTADEESHLATPRFQRSAVPSEPDEPARTAEESRAKADPDSGIGPGDRPGAQGDEFTDSGAQPPP
jgi:hypothetical protein